MKGSPFATSVFGAGNLEQRLVSCGIRLKSLEPMLTLANTASAYWSPTGLNLSRGLYFSTIPSLSVNATLAPKAALVHNYLISLSDLDEPLTGEAWNGNPRYLGLDASATTGSCPAIIAIAPSASTILTSVLIEVVCHWEVRGHATASFSEPNASDPSAYGKATSAVSDFLRRVGPRMFSIGEALSATLMTYSTLSGLTGGGGGGRLVYPPMGQPL
jgi:hypothetical protein